MNKLKSLINKKLLKSNRCKFVCDIYSSTLSIEHDISKQGILQHVLMFSWVNHAINTGRVLVEGCTKYHGHEFDIRVNVCYLTAPRGLLYQAT